MPTQRLSRFILLPELKMTACHPDGIGYTAFHAEKVSEMEVCPRCATPSTSVYDSRIVTIKDAPVRGRRVKLFIKKRRFRCRVCKRPFTEPVSGISKGRRYTQRYREHLLWACENFCDLKGVRKHLDCSYGFIYKSLYEQLELSRRKRLYPWPRSIGIDEHKFKSAKKDARTEFVSFIIDHKNRKAFDVIKGRSIEELESCLYPIHGKENVLFATIDLSDTYRRFIRRNFPNAQIVADKFHVARLLNQTINKKRKEITGDRRLNPIRKLLLMSSHRLSFQTRCTIYRWLNFYPDLRELYEWKEALLRFYRIRGYNKARRALIRMTDGMQKSRLDEIQTLRKTLLSWFNEILAYFSTGLTNARVEGFNNKAKLIRKRAYGYRSFKNYRLRLLNACA